MDATQNFINNNMQLVKDKKIEIEPIINDINDGNFFNRTMIEICEQNQEKQLKKWEEVITDKLATAILQSLQELEAKN
jgi:ketol-acid reductoisomerase